MTEDAQREPFEASSVSGDSYSNNVVEFAGYREDLRKWAALQLHSRQEADDVVQDIYQQLLLYPARNAIRNPRAWVWRIAWRVLHKARRELRSTKADIAVDPGVLEEWANSDGTHVAPSAERHLEAQDELLEALQGLPLPTQIAIVRSRRDDWSLEQIAAELNVSTHMVKKHLSRALQHFTALSAARVAKRKDIAK